MATVDQAIQTGGEAPDIGEIARQVLGAMIADPNKAADGIGWATAYDDKSEPIWKVIVILGSDNVVSTDAAIRALIVKPADVFETVPGIFEEIPTTAVVLPPKPAAPEPAKKKGSRRRGRRYRPSRRSPH